MTKANNKIPTNHYNDKYSSLIRPIKIFLPTQDKKENVEEHKYDDFVGRERLMEKLFNWLSDKKKESGSYLVTGFRGMGKTILVDRVVNKLTREVDEKSEPWCLLLSLVPVIVFGILIALKPSPITHQNVYCWIAFGIMIVWFVSVFMVHFFDKRHYIRKKQKARKKYPNHEQFDYANVDKMARGKNDDYGMRSYNNIKISINLGHEVLKERDVLSMIATSVRDKYKVFFRSSKPHLDIKSIIIFAVSTVSIAINLVFQINVNENINVEINNDVKINNTEVSIDMCNSPISVQEEMSNTQELVVSGRSDNSNNQQVFVNGDSSESWFSRMFTKTERFFVNVYKDEGNRTLNFVLRFLIYILTFVVLKWLLKKLFRFVPYYSTPIRALRRLEVLTERLNTVVGEETGMAPSAQNSVFTFSIFSRRRHKTKPIADIREIETELAEIINMINSDQCHKDYQANFIVVFDEMDKIDPAMMEQHKTTEMPEFTDSVKGFPDGMDSRERRRNVLKLLANIKLFVSTAKAKFVFISGRELYDAYLADLSDRDFAISSIFSGVINVDSFLTPEGGQTDVRSMSEWYIANKLIPVEWLRKKEIMNAEGRNGKNGKQDENRAVYKQERPSLRWYYEYLVDKDKCNNDPQEAAYVIGFLHTFAAYLTHISNGSPKKIFLYFDKYLRCASDCNPLNDWNDVCCAGRYEGGDQKVLYFDATQQKTINFVFFLSNPIMGTITNDKSNYGDRFLVSLSFIIDHIYKYHSRSFSWRNLEQIPDLLKTSKAPELRDEMMSIMEYLSQIHISPILIGLNEYKFHKSIAEEISVISRISEEASAIFNFTLDESLSVIQYNTRLLNYYIGLDKESRDKDDANSKMQYRPIIARIHSNLGDLHYWDEDYYSATMEFRSAIETLPDSEEDESGFLTRVRCMLKLGLTYELRKLYPNAYQTYCRLISLLIKRRWVNEEHFGISVIDARTTGWQDKRQVMVYPKKRLLLNIMSSSQREELFDQQFHRQLFEGDYNKVGNIETDYNINFDGIISTFARDLTVEKSQTINKLTLFEEIRYLYQSILAKLSILEKMGMSGITQTNIDVAEGEFRTIHKSVNIIEKFIIAADFFRKLAEILYYKNNLTILTQNQDSFYASVYYDDHDLMANLDDFCMDKDVCKNAFVAKHDIQYFFNQLNNCAAKEKEPRFVYTSFKKDGLCSLKELYQNLKENLDGYIKIGEDIISDNETDKEETKKRITDNVRAYLDYNIFKVAVNSKDIFYFRTVEACEYHCKLLRERGYRTPCYACKYYTRSLRILADHMFIGKSMVLRNRLTKSFGILKHSFKNKLLYTNSTNLRALAQTLEGFGNVMYACASGNDCESGGYNIKCGISSTVIKMLDELSQQMSENDEVKIIEKYEADNKLPKSLTRLDKSILYYWDAFRFYLMDSCYNEAVGCLNKILNAFVYYIEVLCYYGKDNRLKWENESDTIVLLIGDKEFNHSFVATLFRLISRYTSYKYDHTNLNEINELKWIYSKEIRDDIDLTMLSNYPAIRTAWLRAIEIKAKGLGFLVKHTNDKPDEVKKKGDYLEFIKITYPLIAPKRRYETTFYEEVMGYYTKMRYNDHILNILLDGNPMLDHNTGGYHALYHINFYEKLLAYLNMDPNENSLDYSLFGIKDKDVNKRLELLEYLIHDTLVCITKMVGVFTPHSHLTSYSKSFIGIVYNFYWEWARKYEFVFSLYQYKELKEKIDCEETETDLRDWAKNEADRIFKNITNSGSMQSQNKRDIRGRLEKVLDDLINLIPSDKNDIVKNKYGFRSDRLYERMRHDIDDITINTIYSNYSAEMALKYYKMAEEANTEGEAYKEMVGAMHFLNDDLNNDTCQFNIACDRFLLNCGVVAEQRCHLEEIYRNSNVYNLYNAYINGPNKHNSESFSPHQFDRSQFVNSEY